MLQHRRQDLAGKQAVLVGVDADGQLVSVGCGLEHALAGPARCREHDVRAAVDLRFREFPALDGIAPGLRRRTGHVGDDLTLCDDGLEALCVAASEPRDERNVLPADEAHLVRLGRLARDDANEVGAFLLLEERRVHIRLVDFNVDGAEDRFRIFGRDFLNRCGPGKAGCQNRVEAILGEPPQGLLSLGVVL